MKKTRLLVSLAVVLLLVALCTIFLWQRQHSTTNEKAQSPTSTPIISANPKTLSPTQVKEKANIVVSSPKINETVSLPIVIRGEARVFENQFNYLVRDADGTILTEGSAYANSPDSGLFGAFVITIHAMAEPTGTRGTIEVFDYSAKDGTEIDKMSIPVVFAKEKNTTIRVYFGSNQQPGGLVCENVAPVLRSIAKTQTPAKIATEELLKGPTESEKLHGYFTSINTNVKIQKLTIIDGIARVDFDKRLEEGIGGSCMVVAIRAQIVQTLKQFSTVKEVIISIDGRTEDILQP